MGEAGGGEEALAAAFRARFGRWPEGMWQAPGRVNLIGEHTDYNAGLALPFAIDRTVTVAGARRGDHLVRGWSAQAAELLESQIGALRPGQASGWCAYPLGVLWAFGRDGIDLPGFDLAVDATLPIGAGLASSAALQGAIAMAVNELAAAGQERAQLVELCHRAEVEFAGTPVGRLDHIAVLCGRRHHGLLIDFEERTVEEVPLPIGSLLVVDTGTGHRTAGGEYAARRRQCEAAATRLGLESLRHATVADVEARLTGVTRRRARHVVTENGRVREVARRLRAGGGVLGDLLTRSHASLRDDFEVSTPALDAVVEAAVAAGADGARLTGAGFGGCAIVLGLSASTLRDALDARELTPVPTVFAVTPSDGARRVR